MMLVILCIWHSIIASVIFYLVPVEIERLDPTNFFVLIDRYVFAGLFTTYIFTHVALFVWLIHIPYKRRREMERLDREYSTERRALSPTQLETKQELMFRRASSILEISPNMKFSRGFRKSDGSIIIPNGTTFIPIQEISSEASRNAMGMIEIREPDDQC